VNKSERDEQIDADILKSRADVLRARDVIPPFDKETSREAKPEPKEARQGETTPAPASEKRGKPSESGPEAPEAKRGENKLAAAADSRPEQAEIPRFDLAEDIMAEQRRITAVRRKAPDKKTEPQELEAEVQAVSHTFEKPKPAGPYGDRIIAELVARDIERLLREGN